jgi:hypothetical protein
VGSKADYLENKLLDLVLGATAFAAPGTVYLALFTAMPSDSGGGTEVSGGSYARVAITNNATNWPAAAGGSKSNGTDIVFPAATADWGTLLGWGLFDAASAGNLLYWGRLVGPEFPFTADASTDTFRAPGSAFTNGDKVVTEAGTLGALPTGVDALTEYFVINASTDTFKLSLTSGGAAIDITADGGGRVGKSLSKLTQTGDTPKFVTGQLTVTED